MQTLLRATCAALVALGCLSTVSAEASSPREAVTQRRAAGVVVVKAAKPEVVEGDRLVLTVNVPRAASAATVTVERYGLDGLNRPEWQKVASRKATAKAQFKVTVTDKNKATYRAVVKYRGVAKPVVSKPVAIKVWRWVPLDDFSRYYTTGGTGFGTATLSGRTYNAWGTYTFARSGAHEDRFTPGRNCKAFKGLAGVTDLSDDASSGSVTVYADDAPVWQSPSLTPGMTVPFEVPLAVPYRLGIVAANTSAEGVKAYAAIGDPVLLCTNL